MTGNLVTIKPSMYGHDILTVLADGVVLEYSKCLNMFCPLARCRSSGVSSFSITHPLLSDLPADFCHMHKLIDDYGRR